MAVSINDVRETVLAICNKNNYGYISPDDFNLYAKQAQLDILDEYMPIYNQMMISQKRHLSGVDTSDLANRARENIERLSTADSLAFVSSNPASSLFTIPSDSYHVVDVYYSGLTDTVEVDRVSAAQSSRLRASNLTSPTAQDPIYTISGSEVNVSPSSIQADISAYYIRYPATPVWGYVTLINGEPIYDAGSSTDFELQPDEESQLVAKILEKAGISIREQEVYRNAQMTDNKPQ
jgi:hypothetical protein